MQAQRQVPRCRAVFRRLDLRHAFNPRPSSKSPVSESVTNAWSARPTYRIRSRWLGPARLSRDNDLVDREHRPRSIRRQFDGPVL